MTAHAWRTLPGVRTWELVRRLEEAAARAEALQGIVPAYAWEANAYRRAAELIRTA